MCEPVSLIALGTLAFGGIAAVGTMVGAAGTIANAADSIHQHHKKEPQSSTANQQAMYQAYSHPEPAKTVEKFYTNGTASVVFGDDGSMTASGKQTGDWSCGSRVTTGGGSRMAASYPQQQGGYGRPIQGYSQQPVYHPESPPPPYRLSEKENKRFLSRLRGKK